MLKRLSLYLSRTGESILNQRVCKLLGLGIKLVLAAVYYEEELRGVLHSKQVELEARRASRSKMRGAHPRGARDGWAGPPKAN